MKANQIKMYQTHAYVSLMYAGIYNSTTNYLYDLQINNFIDKNNNK